MKKKSVVEKAERGNAWRRWRERKNSLSKKGREGRKEKNIMLDEQNGQAFPPLHFFFLFPESNFTQKNNAIFHRNKKLFSMKIVKFV